MPQYIHTSTYAKFSKADSPDDVEQDSRAVRPRWDVWLRTVNVPMTSVTGWKRSRVSVL